MIDLINKILHTNYEADITYYFNIYLKEKINTILHKKSKTIAHHK